MGKTALKKFHLWNSVIQEKLQFYFDQFQIPETKFLIYGRQTVATGKRASPAALIINDSVLKFLQMRRYEILLEYLQEETDVPKEVAAQKMLYDLYLREKLKKRPAFASDQKQYETAIYN